MFATNWIFTIFSSIIPIEHMDKIFDEFFLNSWIFLYKFIIYLLKVYESDILATNDISEMMIPIKSFKPKGKLNEFLASLPFVSKLFQETKWSDFINEAKKEKINEDILKKGFEPCEQKESLDHFNTFQS